MAMIFANDGSVKMSRVWAMPSADTFDIAPIGGFVKRYLAASSVSADPFARNKRWATYTNDLNPQTAAEYHMDAFEFLEMLEQKGVKLDLVIFDPPYSPTQIKQVYQDIGNRTYRAGEENWKREYDKIYQLLQPNGVVLSFGWNTSGMGKSRGCVIKEIMLVAHGAAHNDTICMAELKIGHQASLFDAMPSNNGSQPTEERCG